MTLRDNVSLAFRNLRQSRLRTVLTVLGVAIGIASLAGMLSFGVGFEEQVMSRFRSSGMFDAITVTPASAMRMGGPGPGVAAPDAKPELPLDDEAVATLSALPNVKSVYSTVRVFLLVGHKDFSGYSTVAGVPMTARGEGAFQNVTHGAFFANDTDDTCMLSELMAKRIVGEGGDPKTLVGATLTLSYATSTSPGAAGAPTVPAAPESMQVQRVQIPCPVVGILERETGPGMMAGADVTSVMIPMARAKAIEARQVTSVQSVLRSQERRRGYQMVTVKVTSPVHTLDVQQKVRDLGFSAYSINDALQNAKRGFLIFDIVLALIGSIALAVSSLGIMNTMIMSILERTREIGIMKAIGGSDRDIRKIFLIEASVIGFVGGVAGVILGWIVSRVVNFAANIYIASRGGDRGELFLMPVWLIASAIAFSILISLMAGYYPARRAARLNPIQALRHD